MPEKKYCHCSDFNTARCNRGSAAEQVELKKRDMTTLVNPAANKCNKRKRRSLDAGVVLPEDDDSVFYKYDPAPMEPVNITWPTTSGKTQSQVRSYCNHKLRNSAPGKLCTKLPDFSFDTYVQQCMDDIQVCKKLYTERFCYTIARVPFIEIKVISDCRQRKFSQPVHQNKHGLKGCPATSRASPRLVQAKGGYKVSYVL